MHGLSDVRPGGNAAGRTAAPYEIYRKHVARLGHNRKDLLSRHRHPDIKTLGVFGDRRRKCAFKRFLATTLTDRLLEPSSVDHILQIFLSRNIRTDEELHFIASERKGLVFAHLHPFGYRAFEFHDDFTFIHFERSCGGVADKFILGFNPMAERTHFALLHLKLPRPARSVFVKQQHRIVRFDVGAVFHVSHTGKIGLEKRRFGSAERLAVDFHIVNDSVKMSRRFVRIAEILADTEKRIPFRRIRDGDCAKPRRTGLLEH